jgi:hypothetical protein
VFRLLVSWLFLYAIVACIGWGITLVVTFLTSRQAKVWPVAGVAIAAFAVVTCVLTIAQSFRDPNLRWYEIVLTTIIYGYVAKLAAVSVIVGFGMRREAGHGMSHAVPGSAILREG